MTSYWWGLINICDSDVEDECLCFPDKCYFVDFVCGPVADDELDDDDGLATVYMTDTERTPAETNMGALACEMFAIM